jgi:hypothetical protein
MSTATNSTSLHQVGDESDVARQAVESGYKQHRAALSAFGKSRK